MIRVLLLSVLLFSQIYAQFGSVIFRKEFNVSYYDQNVYSIGDQNGDKCNDFIVFDCSQSKAYIFFGGSPIDTVPKLTISDVKVRSLAAIDVNNDGFKDIVMCTIRSFSDTSVIKIFYGGPLLDTIPDIVFRSPRGVDYGFLYVLNDFNGDGKSELVMYDEDNPNPQYHNQNGNFYFFNTESKFDTIPHVVLKGDTTITEFLDGFPDMFSHGDINGDGKTDITMFGYVKSGNPPFTRYRFFRKFYLGNSTWDFTPAVTYWEKEHTFNVEYMKIIKDINHDGRDDIFMADYGFYPFYFGAVILHGSFPIDTIPSEGINGQNMWVYPVASGDFNGDRVNDFLATVNSAPFSSIKLYIGGRVMPDETKKTWYFGEGGIAKTAEIGDVDGDGIDDIMIERTLVDNHNECNLGTIYIIKGDSSVKGDSVSSVRESENEPEAYRLFDAYPNPFNPSTTISYALPKQSKVELTIYNIMGSEVRTFTINAQEAGYHNFLWDSRNSNGEPVPSGIYIYKLRTISYETGKTFEKAAKMVLVK